MSDNLGNVVIKSKKFSLLHSLPYFLSLNHTYERIVENHSLKTSKQGGTFWWASNVNKGFRCQEFETLFNHSKLLLIGSVSKENHRIYIRDKIGKSREVQTLLFWRWNF